jgi:hypothetical protein
MDMTLRIMVAGLVAVSFGCSASPEPREHEPRAVDRSADTGGAGYCRSTTCAPPTGYPEEGGLCEPPGWEDSTTCADQHASNAPLWWRGACVGYDLQRSGSAHVAFNVFSDAVHGAVAAWTRASCPSRGGRDGGVSIDLRDLGPVSCARIGYEPKGPNQNVIVFRDDVWPAHEAAPWATVALTTVSFDPQSGEIFDADIELNTADHQIVPVDPADTESAAFDLQAVLTHEFGHFLGLGHATTHSAMMFAYASPSDQRRALAQEDIEGMCTIYPPDGTRSVSTLVSPDGKVPASACDPTPRHGLGYACD